MLNSFVFCLFFKTFFLIRRFTVVFKFACAFFRCLSPIDILDSREKYHPNTLIWICCLWGAKTSAAAASRKKMYKQSTRKSKLNGFEEVCCLFTKWDFKFNSFYIYDDTLFIHTTYISFVSLSVWETEGSQLTISISYPYSFTWIFVEEV